MNYYCQQRLDEPPDCRTWDQCHHRGICLAKPKQPVPFPRFRPISELGEQPNGIDVLVFEHGRWHITQTRKHYGYLGACAGFYVCSELPRDVTP